MRVELFDDTIDNLSLFDPLTGAVIAQSAALHRLPRHALRDAARAADRARSTRSGRTCACGWRSCATAGKLLEAQRLEQRTHVRYGDDAGGRLLRGHRELLALSVGPRSPASRRRACSTTCRRMRCWSSMRATRPFRSSAPCTEATARARKPWSSTASGCPRRWITGRSKFEEWERLAPQMIFVSATPGPYENNARGAGGRAGGAPHGSGRPAGRSAPGAHAGGRCALRDPPVRRRTASAC